MRKQGARGLKDLLSRRVLDKDRFTQTFISTMSIMFWAMRTAIYIDNILYKK